MHFTLCLLVSGKDHAEELCDVEVESMYPLVVFFTSFVLKKLTLMIQLQILASLPSKFVFSSWKFLENFFLVQSLAA